MREDFIEFKEYYREAAAKVPADSFFRQTMNHKFKHSVEVLHIGQTILHNTPELKNASPEFIKLAETALLFHDVGRFEEAYKQYKAQKKGIIIAASSNIYDHGLIGYNLLKKNPKYNDMRILFALKWHGKMPEEITASTDWKKATSSPDFASIKQILLLVRDADKLANLYHIKQNNQLEKDLFYRQLTKEAMFSPLSPAVWQQFSERRTILFSNVYSFADRILLVLSWIFDLNYQATKQIFNNNGYTEYLLDLLSKYHQNANDISKITSIIKEQKI